MLAATLEYSEGVVPVFEAAAPLHAVAVAARITAIFIVLMTVALLLVAVGIILALALVARSTVATAARYIVVAAAVPTAKALELLLKRQRLRRFLRLPLVRHVRERTLADRKPVTPLVLVLVVLVASSHALSPTAQRLRLLVPPLLLLLPLFLFLLAAPTADPRLARRCRNGVALALGCADGIEASGDRGEQRHGATAREAVLVQVPGRRRRRRKRQEETEEGQKLSAQIAINAYANC